MRRFAVLLLATLAVAVSGSQSAKAAPSPEAKAAWIRSWRVANPTWRGLHLMVQSEEQSDALIEQLPKFAALGVNVIVIEVDYAFEFQSHPELRGKRFVTKAGARRLAKAAHDHGIRLIPELDCLGHQSWRQTTLPLLAKYPQFDETPGQLPDNDKIYCRSWCPQNPGVNPIVFSLIDELINAFDADAFHAGMDEVFIMASESCPRCRGRDPAKLFAQSVNDLHAHIVGKQKVEMLIWGDRLLDAKSTGYSKWEASANGTSAAIDLIPKDIIVCDWHYARRDAYPSVPLLLSKGFRVWPSGWQPLEATKAFSAYSRKQQNQHLIGYLCTVWSKASITNAAQWPPIVDVLRDWK
jgi:hypothetical protein